MPAAGWQAPASIRAAMVDLDGTLVDTLQDFVEALRRTLADLGLPAADAALVRQLVGKGSRHLLRSVLAAQVPAHEVAPLEDAAWSAYQRHYQAVNGTHARVYEGVPQGLARLRDRGWPLACLTNKPTAFARPLLERTGLAAYFGLVHGGDAFERLKPDPLPLQRTCAALGLAPTQVLMIGDSRNDAQAARAAGCPVVLVTYGYNHGEPVREVDADAWVDRLDEITLAAPAITARAPAHPARGA